MEIQRLNELQRGFELSTGREIPSQNLTEIEGREKELRELWEAASPEEKEFIEKANRSVDERLNRLEETGS